MDRKLFPEMVELINKTLARSHHKGIPIPSQWHCPTPTNLHQQYSSTVDAFRRHKDLVVALTVNDALVYNPALYSGIKSLTVTDPSETPFEVDPQEFAPSHIFPTLVMLEHLGLDSIRPNKINWFLKPLFFFMNLRSLVLTDTFLDREGALLLWKTFPSLEVLSLIEVHFLDLSAVRENMKGMLCTRLTKLYLHYNDGGFPMEDQFQLLLACPSLEAFHWALPTGSEEYTFHTNFGKFVQGWIPLPAPEIEELQIVGEMDDYGIALAMNNMPGIRSLSITVDNPIGMMSLAAISNHATNLTRFEAHSPFTTSIAIQLVLSSCPLLHTLIARTMTAYEVTRDKQRKWICAPSLKVLCLSFLFESHEAHLQDGVCEKLAQLTQLEQLIMYEHCDDRPGTFGLLLRLGEGLERLSDLKNMAFLTTRDDLTHPSRIEELSWVRTHWPNIESYYLNPGVSTKS
ncbi:hypothetical protein BGZ75_006994 [Mortierella antarctica]|nr:hypothetical protein BGZ75_006994 [Mortierella antarctica]